MTGENIENVFDDMFITGPSKMVDSLFSFICMITLFAV